LSQKHQELFYIKHRHNKLQNTQLALKRRL